MRFVIIASPRTGSSHLVNMLSGHPEVFCNGNSLHPKHMWLFWPGKDLTPAVKRELRELRERKVSAFLDRLFTTGYGRPHVGFKIFNGQNNGALRDMIHDTAVRKIILYRRNVLANYSSAMTARQIGQWGAQEGQDIPDAPKVRFEERSFIKFYNQYVGFYRDVISSVTGTGQYAHTIEYREINDPLLFASLVTFIGADSTRPISKDAQFKRQVKLNSPDIISRFENAGTVHKFLERKGLMHWVYEGDTSLEPFDGGDTAAKPGHDVCAAS